MYRDALLRGFFLVLRDFRPTCTASEELQWSEPLTLIAVIAAIHFFQSTKSHGRVLPETSLRYVSLRHSNLLTFCQQGWIGSQGPSYEFGLQ